MFIFLLLFSAANTRSGIPRQAGNDQRTRPQTKYGVCPCQNETCGCPRVYSLFIFAKRVYVVLQKETAPLLLVHIHHARMRRSRLIDTGIPEARSAPLRKVHHVSFDNFM